MHTIWVLEVIICVHFGISPYDTPWPSNDTYPPLFRVEPQPFENRALQLPL